MTTPSVSNKKKRVDELIEATAASLSRRAFFEAERMAQKAITLAQQANDFRRMAATVDPLLKARMGRMQLAIDAATAGRITIVDEPITDQMKLEPGFFLVQPPQVGADARRLRMAALQNEIPVLVICREPLTKLGLSPVVAIGPGATVRTRIDPPANYDQPELQWFLDALNALGQEAIAAIDSEMEVTRRLRHILERLDTVPEHADLHDLLKQTCLEAARQAQAAAAKAANKAAAKRKAKV